MRLKASFTIEAALIMPVVITVIFFVLFIGFYENDKAVIAEKAFLCAREMAFDESPDGFYLTQMKKECMHAKSINMEYNDRSIASEAISSGCIEIYFLNFGFEIGTRQSYTKCYAPEMIRKVNTLIRIKNTVID